jgi:hypothetical protein
MVALRFRQLCGLQRRQLTLEPAVAAIIAGTIVNDDVPFLPSLWVILRGKYLQGFLSFHLLA